MYHFPKISVVVPLFNEEESIPELCEWIQRVCVSNGLSYEVLLIDDGSSDGTRAWLETLPAQRFRILELRPGSRPRDDQVRLPRHRSCDLGAEREGLRGKVQCIYFDPPYGIKFNSMTVALGSWDGEEDWEDESIFFYLDGANPIGNHGDFVITELSN